MFAASENDKIMQARFGPKLPALIGDFVRDPTMYRQVSKTHNAQFMHRVEEFVRQQFAGSMTAERLIQELDAFGDPRNVDELEYTFTKSRFLELSELLNKSADILPHIWGEKLYYRLMRILFNMGTKAEEDGDYELARDRFLGDVFQKYAHIQPAIEFWRLHKQRSERVLNELGGHAQMEQIEAVFSNIRTLFPHSFFEDRTQVSSEVVPSGLDYREIQRFGDLWYEAELPLYNDVTGEILPEFTHFPQALEGEGEQDEEDEEFAERAEKEIGEMADVMVQRFFGGGDENLVLPTWDDVRDGGDGDFHPFAERARQVTETVSTVISQYLLYREIDTITWSEAWKKALAACLIADTRLYRTLEYFTMLRGPKQLAGNIIEEVLFTHVLPITDTMNVRRFTAWETSDQIDWTPVFEALIRQSVLKVSRHAQECLAAILGITKLKIPENVIKHNISDMMHYLIESADKFSLFETYLFRAAPFHVLRTLLRYANRKKMSVNVIDAYVPRFTESVADRIVFAALHRELATQWTLHPRNLNFQPICDAAQRWLEDGEDEDDEEGLRADMFYPDGTPRLTALLASNSEGQDEGTNAAGIFAAKMFLHEGIDVRLKQLVFGENVELVERLKAMAGRI